jgi:hypothetical protein
MPMPRLRHPIGVREPPISQPAYKRGRSSPATRIASCPEPPLRHWPSTPSSRTRFFSQPPNLLGSSARTFWSSHIRVLRRPNSRLARAQTLAAPAAGLRRARSPVVFLPPNQHPNRSHVTPRPHSSPSLALSSEHLAGFYRAAPHRPMAQGPHCEALLLFKGLCANQGHICSIQIFPGFYS